MPQPKLSHPILAIAGARLREFIRRPETIFWVYLFPVLMVGVLGMAFRNQTPEQFQIATTEGIAGEVLQQILQPQNKIEIELLPPDQAQTRLRQGKILLLVTGNLAGPATPDPDRVSVGTGADPAHASFDSFQYTFDPQRPGSLQARNFVNDFLQQQAGRSDPVPPEDIAFDQPGGRYVDFLVPGLLGMSLMGGGLWGIGFAIVDMRIRKLLKRLMATPMRRYDFLIGMLLSRLIFMIPQIAILLLFSYWLFDVRIQGNWGSVALVILLGAIEFSVIGLLVASRAQTMETISGLMNLVMLPMYTLCGIFFSYEKFPEVIQPVIKWLPLTPLIDALRGLMLDGASLSSLGPELLVIFVWCLIPFMIAMKIFRWQD
jgi:ABC-2 type transport system permease protein